MDDFNEYLIKLCGTNLWETDKILLFYIANKNKKSKIKIRLKPLELDSLAVNGDISSFGLTQSSFWHYLFASEKYVIQIGSYLKGMFCKKIPFLCQSVYCRIG